MKHVPNALTLLRLALAPVVAGLIWLAFETRGGVYSQPLVDSALMSAAAAIFVLAALTDLFDGMIARAFNHHSKFGRIIDPIADKALVGLPLVAIATVAALAGLAEWPWIVVATGVIVVRDITMTAIRFLSPDGEGARVSSLAKIKTAIELVAVGAILALLAFEPRLMSGGSISASPAALLGWGWLGLVMLAAALSAWTGWQYVRPAKPPP